MSSANDQQFLGTAGIVLGVLVGITVVIIIIANIVDRPPAELRAAEVERIESRITPVAMVVTDESALQRAAANDAQEALEPGEINQRYCAACHGSGVLDAPVLGSADDWGPRLDEAGLDGLVQQAIEGTGQMPARGGAPDLSDDDIRNTVEWMLEQAGL